MTNVTFSLIDPDTDQADFLKAILRHLYDVVHPEHYQLFTTNYPYVDWKIPSVADLSKDNKDIDFERVTFDTWVFRFGVSHTGKAAFLRMDPTQETPNGPLLPY